MPFAFNLAAVDQSEIEKLDKYVVMGQTLRTYWVNATPTFLALYMLSEQAF